MADENALNSPLYLRHKIAYIFAEKFSKDKVVLDTASGSGYGSYHLVTSGAKKVTGADISIEAVEYARQRYRIDNLKFEVMDATELNFDDDTFEVLVSFQTIEQICFNLNPQ
jgi:ubiquinone/menaquinone biosynthesis C-methylase UbiE